MSLKLLAILIFVLIYFLIMLGKIHRTILAILGAVLFAAIPLPTAEGIKLGILNQADLLSAVNWEALGLIFGMFTLVAALRESGFFRWLGLTILKVTNFDIFKIFVLFALTAAVLSAFMDSITVLLFMATLTLETCSFLKVNPISLIILEIASANIGGSATMVGDPPNIIIGTGLHFSFMDFVRNTGPIAIGAFLINLLFFYFWYRKMFEKRKELSQEILTKHVHLDPKTAIIDGRLMGIGILIFVFIVGLLTVHHLLNLSVAFIGILGASLILLLGGEKMQEIIERIDWSTLIFFACLFIMVGGLDKVGVLSDIAAGIGNLFKGNLFLSVMTLLWFSALASAFIDNVPFAAAMIPIVKNLALTYGLPLSTMAWALALGTDIGGNGTPIGASANVVGLSVAEKGGEKVSWGYYLKVAFPAMLVSVTVCGIFIYLRYLI